MSLFGKAAASARVYDRVAVLDEEGVESRQLTPEAFDELGLDERVRLILGKRLRFYRGQSSVPLKEALRESS